MNKKGFTLVELIAVVAILGLLAVITTPAYDTISKNIKTTNYESKQNTIKKQTLSYVEKYLKDKVYDGSNINYLCFTVQYLIRNGIISSDGEDEEYILNDMTSHKYQKKENYIQISYDKDKLKLVAYTIEEKYEKDNNNNMKCSDKEIY